MTNTSTLVVPNSVATSTSTSTSASAWRPDFNQPDPYAGMPASYAQEVARDFVPTQGELLSPVQKAMAQEQSSSNLPNSVSGSTSTKDITSPTFTSTTTNPSSSAKQIVLTPQQYQQTQVALTSLQSNGFATQNPDGSYTINVTNLGGKTVDVDDIKKAFPNMSEQGIDNILSQIAVKQSVSNLQSLGKGIVSGSGSGTRINISSAIGAGANKSDLINVVGQDAYTQGLTQYNSQQALIKAGVVTQSGNGNNLSIDWNKVTSTNYSDLKNLGVKDSDIVSAQNKISSSSGSGSSSGSNSTTNPNANANALATKVEIVPSVDSGSKSISDMSYMYAHPGTYYIVNNNKVNNLSGADLQPVLSEINAALVDKNGSESGQMLSLNSKIEDAGLWDNKLFNNTRIGGTTYVTDKKGNILTTQGQVNIQWNNLTQDQKNQVAGTYNNDLYRTNAFSELTSLEEQQAAKGGIIGGMAYGPITGMENPFAKVASGQKTTYGDWTGAVITAATDVLVPFGPLGFGVPNIISPAVTGVAFTGMAAINAPNVVTTIRDPNATTSQKWMAIGGEALLTAPAILKVTTPLREAIIPKISFDWETIGKNTSNFITAAEGGEDLGIKSPIIVTAPKIEKLVGNFDVVLKSNISGDPANSIITTSKGLSYTPPQWMTKSSDYVSNIGRNWFPTSPSKGVIGDFSVEDITAQQNMSTGTNLISDTNFRYVPNTTGSGNTYGYYSARTPDITYSNPGVNITKGLSANVIDLPNFEPSITPEAKLSINPFNNSVEYPSSGLHNIRLGDFQPRISAPLIEPEGLVDPNLMSSMAKNTPGGIVSEGSAKGIDYFQKGTIPTTDYFYGGGGNNTGFNPEATDPFTNLGYSRPSIPSSTKPISGIDIPSSTTGQVISSSARSAGLQAENRLISPELLSPTINPSVLPEIAYPIPLTMVPLTRTETFSPSRIEVLNPSIIEQDSKLLTSLVPLTAMQTNINTQQQMINDVSMNQSLLVQPETLMNTGMNQQLIQSVQPITVVNRDTNTEMKSDVNTEREVNVQRTSEVMIKTQVPTMVSVETITPTTLIENINPPPEDIIPPPKEKFFFDLFPPHKKKDKKKKKKEQQYTNPKEQYQFLFSKTPELQLHMPTGSQLKSGGILGGELTERKVTVLEPSTTKEEGARLGTRTYDRVRGQRSNDYRGITRTNLGVV